MLQDNNRSSVTAAKKLVEHKTKATRDNAVYTESFDDVARREVTAAEANPTELGKGNLRKHAVPAQ
jgi:hypothetical protein